MGSKWDTEKFTGSNDFVLWKVKMQAVLIQQKCVQALKDEPAMLENLIQAEKGEMIYKENNVIVLCLEDKVLSSRSIFVIKGAMVVLPFKLRWSPMKMDMSAGALVVTSSKSEKSWVLDLGFSYHMCPRKEYFKTFGSKRRRSCSTRNNKACKVQGMGTVRLKMFDCCEFLLRYVRFVPELMRNLISLNMFDSLDYCIRIEYGVYEISHGALITLKGSKMNGLYILDGSIVIGNVSAASVVPHNNSELWHLRLRL
ncbi:hypothetical protein MTR_1g027280 [Medicago truncatula]|uniref:Retrovirus-related Pol polyprotein from transposon TNT 1-94-like beta-barrel domain-containing protein n=1 Tax=Medicago truncatula TaxID=3880 RepID=A0A072VE87_MEDTR|nr:hypothetical protein MTR_1g027280 [Medicago truncatula]